MFVTGFLFCLWVALWYGRESVQLALVQRAQGLDEGKARAWLQSPWPRFGLTASRTAFLIAGVGFLCLQGGLLPLRAVEGLLPTAAGCGAVAGFARLWLEDRGHGSS